ncbi:MAG: TAXI family TRAP transporter solute-binding subunit [Sphaerochaetaceae bacterium]|nr:TAXI family TRAP transporter solute-binding subunit [Sphaerochaetaceae bacterium]
MKKLVVVILVLACVASVFAQGDSEGTKATPQQLTFGTASAGGAFYVVGTGISEVVSQKVDNLYVTAEITGGSVKNCILVGTGESDLAISNADHVVNAVNGVNQYDKKYDLRAICSMHASILHMVTLPGKGINTPADLKGKKVAVGPAGGGSEPMVKAVLEAYGLSFDDIKPSYLSYDDGITQLKDGQVDVALVGAGFPASAVMSLQATNKVVMLSLTDETMAKVSTIVPAYSKIVVPAETYGMDTDVIVLGVRNIVYCSPDLSEETVYNITKAIYENLDEIKTYTAALDNVKLEELTDVAGVEMHEGAKRYYKEKGLL